MSNVEFFPVIHLLTGPPGLTRNGGIWKSVKSQLSKVLSPPRIMVQALHFSSYTLSQGAWDDWFFGSGESKNRLTRELTKTFGDDKDIFVDSGGFQLLNLSRIDLSKWQIRLTPEDIFHLQMRYAPDRIASLDSPISPRFPKDEVRALMKFSIENAVWLTKNIETTQKPPVPYLVVHGRDPNEIRSYLHRFEKALPKGWLRNDRYGIALGSQVPLAPNPQTVIDNCAEVLHWMKNTCPPTIPFHIFGIGENVVREVIKIPSRDRTISYDNSTYIQNAFRCKIYDQDLKRYKSFSPFDMPKCGCAACTKLNAYGPEFVSNLLAKRPYNPSNAGDEKVNRSDIFGLIGLHNLGLWETRILDGISPKRRNSNGNPLSRVELTSTCKEYSFPLAAFEPLSPNLLLLPCSKSRPYGSSPSHKRITSILAKEGLQESRDYDRITLSGVYGPVHWRHEEHPAILQYDFTLGTEVSKEHIQFLRMRTAMVLNVISKKYEDKVAYIRSKRYQNAFEPILNRFDIPLLDDISELPNAFGTLSH
jgi:tRNA-guanine family transglycosylase